MVTEIQFLDQGFRLETPKLSGRRTALYLRFLTGNPEIAGEIQILRQVLRTKTQILIVISSPANVLKNSKKVDNLYKFFLHV